jgi:ankyrin repeat protein
MADLWDDPDAMRAYLSDLMIPSRPNRKGFPAEVAAEIFILSQTYDTIRASKPERSTDIWETERAVAELEQLGMLRTPQNFARAVESGNHELCMLFISAGMDVNCRDVRHWTPLMVAAFNGRETVALALILNGGDVRAEDKGGYSPMHWAAFNGYARVIKLLLQEGAAPNASSRSGITPMLQAAARGRLPVVEELLKNGADPNIAANDGTTPLIKAIANGHLAVVDALLEAGANVDVTMKDGTTLAQVAKGSKYRKIRERNAAAMDSRRAEKAA